MYELIILSLLMRFPMHGYLIAKIANDLIGPWAKISVGSFYPLLSKLEQQGYITEVVEKWIPIETHPGGGVRRDLFEVIDILCIQGGALLAIQSTSGSNHQKLARPWKMMIDHRNMGGCWYEKS